MRNVAKLAVLTIVAGISAGCAKQYPISAEALSNQVLSIAQQPTATTTTASKVPLNSFRTALKTVAASHPRIKSADTQAKRAAAAVNERAAGTKPQASITGRAGQYDEGNGWNDAAAIGIDVSQLIYDGGATKASMDAAQAAMVKARFAAEATRNQVIEGSASTWIDVWYLQERIKQMNLRLDEAKPLITRIKKMAETGLADRTIIEKADKSILDVKIERQRLETALSEASGKFQSYFGRQPLKLAAPSVLASEKIIATSLKSWKKSPQIAVSAAEVIIADYELAIAKADLKPQIMGNLGSTAPLSSDNPVQSVGVVVKYTFGDGGRRKSRIESAQDRQRAAKDDLEATIQDLEGAVSTAKLTYTDIQKGIDLVQQQIAVLKQSRETARSQIASAQSNLNTLLETEIDLYRAEDRLLSLKAEKMKLEAKILQLAGVLAEQVKN